MEAIYRATPPLPEPAGYPAITRSDSAMYIYGPIFAAYQQHGNLIFRALVGRCLDMLLPDRIVETNAPASTEVALSRQGDRDVLHLINYTPGRRAPGHIEILEQPIPLHDITIRLRRTAETSRVHNPLAGVDLDFQSDAGVVTVRVPRIDTHAVMVFEPA